MLIYTFVQARLGSSRLPRKVLANVEGESLLERVMRSAGGIGYPVALLIPTHDHELAAYAIDRDWMYCLGPEEDVLKRFALAARALNADHVIRVCGDSPFIDADEAKHTVREHLHGGYDLTTDHDYEGRGVQVFRVPALLRADETASRYFRHSPDEWILDRDKAYSVRYMKWSVDTPDDLERARRRINGT